MYRMVFLFTPPAFAGTYVPTHGGMVQAELTWMAGSALRWFTEVVAGLV